MGAVGVARAFVFNGMRGKPLAEARTVLATRLLPREKMMKTASGMELAKGCGDFLRTFMARWDFEVGPL